MRRSDKLFGHTGTRESAHDWRVLLLDLKRRGLTIAPELAVADGALGFWKALGEVVAFATFESWLDIRL